MVLVFEVHITVDDTDKVDERITSVGKVLEREVRLNFNDGVVDFIEVADR